MINAGNSRTGIMYAVTLGLIDLGAYHVSLAAAVWLRRIAPAVFPGLIELQFDYAYFASFWWIPAIFVFFFFHQGLYTRRRPLWSEGWHVIVALTTAFVTVLAIITLGKITNEVSRLAMLLLWVSSLGIFFLGRYFGKRAMHRLPFFRERALVIGSGEDARRAAASITREPHLGYEVVGFVSVSGAKGEDVLGGLDDLYDIIGDTGTSTVIISQTEMDQNTMQDIAGRLQSAVRHVILIPDFRGVALANSESHNIIFEQVFYLLLKNNLKLATNRAVKRTFDIIVCIIGLPFVLAVTAVVAVMIKLDSKGPVFYAHGRVGQNGKDVPILKFRTMYRDAAERLEKLLDEDADIRREWEAYYKLKHDPRVTKVGAFLRKTSLDELPQVFNVLVGTMSLVGPRPVVRDELEKYYAKQADYYLLVKPGITGLWQVSGRSNTDYEFRVNRDTWYVLNWSLWLDVIILLRTPAVVLRREGAY